MRTLVGTEHSRAPDPDPDPEPEPDPDPDPDPASPHTVRYSGEDQAECLFKAEMSSEGWF